MEGRLPALLTRDGTQFPGQIPAPPTPDLATLIAMADTDEVVRLRLLRAIRYLGV